MSLDFLSTALDVPANYLLGSQLPEYWGWLYEASDKDAGRDRARLASENKVEARERSAVRRELALRHAIASTNDARAHTEHGRQYLSMHADSIGHRIKRVSKLLDAYPETVPPGWYAKREDPAVTESLRRVLSTGAARTGRRKK
jgi:hypothetical protein